MRKLYGSLQCENCGASVNVSREIENQAPNVSDEIFDEVEDIACCDKPFCQWKTMLDFYLEEDNDG